MINMSRKSGQEKREKQTLWCSFICVRNIKSKKKKIKFSATVTSLNKQQPPVPEEQDPVNPLKVPKYGVIKYGTNKYGIRKLGTV